MLNASWNIEVIIDSRQDAEREPPVSFYRLFMSTCNVRLFFWTRISQMLFQQTHSVVVGVESHD